MTLQLLATAHGVHARIGPAAHSTTCVALPGHSLHVPSHVRVCGLVPTPHAVEQAAASVHALQLRGTPTLHGCEPVLAPGHEPQSPLQLRVSGCEPCPQLVLHGPTVHSPQLRLLPVW